MIPFIERIEINGKLSKYKGIETVKINGNIFLSLLLKYLIDDVPCVRDRDIFIPRKPIVNVQVLPPILGK